MLDDFDIDAPEGPPPEESSNRTFLMVAGGLGGFALLSLICLAAVFFLRSDGGEVAANPTADAINANNTEVALAAEQTGTAVAQLPTNTPTPEITDTLVPSATPTIDELAPTEVEITPGGPTLHPATATVQALLTQAAIAQTQAAQEILTVTPTATLVLPDTGFADDMGDIGLLGMFTLGSALIVIIFFARRLRSANA